MTSLNSLTPLRGIAALAIVLFHMVHLFPALVPAAVSPLYKSALAVDLFFIMSGLLMVHVYGHQFEDRIGWRDYRGFIKNRFARIYPLHLVTLAAIVGMYLVAKGPPALEGRYSISALVHNLLMTHSPWLDYRSWNFPSWSISAEWHAYLLFPLLMPILARLDRRGMVAVALALLVMLAVLTSLPGRVSNGPAVFLRLLPSFCGGMLLYRLLVSGRAAMLGKPSSVALTVLAFTLAFASGAHDLLIILMFFPLVLACVQGTGRLIDLLNCRPLTYLGEISYSIYMNHALLMFAWPLAVAGAQRAGVSLPSLSLGGAAGLAYLAALVAVVLAGSAFTYHWIEVPCRKWLRDVRMPMRLRAAT